MLVVFPVPGGPCKKLEQREKNSNKCAHKVATRSTHRDDNVIHVAFGGNVFQPFDCFFVANNIIQL